MLITDKKYSRKLVHSELIYVTVKEKVPSLLSDKIYVWFIDTSGVSCVGTWGVETGSGGILEVVTVVMGVVCSWMIAVGTTFVVDVGMICMAAVAVCKVDVSMCDVEMSGMETLSVELLGVGMGLKNQAY